MPRITISTELEKGLQEIKDGSYYIRYDRGFESTVAFLVKDYNERKEVAKQLREMKETIIGTMEKAAENGSMEAFKKMIQNIISF